MTVVVLSAVVPTLIATTFFQRIALTNVEREEVEATDEIDVGPRRREPRISDEGEPA